MKRGEVWWANLPEPSASEPGYQRPAIILQSDEFNRSRIYSIIAAAITSNMRLANAPGNVTVSKRGAGLDRESVVNVSQIVTLDKSFLSKKAGRLSSDIMNEIDEGIRLVLGL